MGRFRLHAGQCILSIEDDPDQISNATQNDQMPEVDLNGPDLKPMEKQDLIWEFWGLFASEESPLGRTTIGAVLSQDVEGEENVIAYWSRQLNGLLNNSKGGIGSCCSNQGDFSLSLWQAVHVADGPQPINVAKGTERYWREAYTLASVPSTI